MTSAQAVTGLPPAPSNGAKDIPSGGSDRTSSSGSSFGDTLDEAQRAQSGKRGASDEGAASAEGARAGTADDSERGAVKSRLGDDGPPSSDAESTPSDNASIAALLAVLAVSLAGGQGASDEASGGSQGQARSDPAIDGVPLPGSEKTETLDASQLLALLDSDATAADDEAPTVGEDAPVLRLQAKVGAQERHLAISQSAGDALEGLLDGDAAPSVAAEADAARAVARDVRLDRDSPRAARDGDSRSTSAVLSLQDAVSAVAEGGAEQGFSDEPGLGGQQANGKQERAPTLSNVPTTAVFSSTLQAAGAGRTESPDPLAGEPASDQIASQIQAELKADGIGKTSSDGVVKVLHIELKPANLGAVTVRLSLKDNVINVHLEAQRRETVAVIEREREALVGALASAGYDVDRITTAAQGESGRLGAALPRVGEASGSGTSGMFQGQSNGDGLGNSPGSGQGNGSGRPSGQPSYTQPSRLNDDKSGLARTPQDGLYV